jgi:hypothetical protein
LVEGALPFLIFAAVMWMVGVENLQWLAGDLPAHQAGRASSGGQLPQRGKLPEFREFSLSRIPASGQPRNRSAAAGIADLTEIHCID